MNNINNIKKICLALSILIAIIIAVPSVSFAAKLSKPTEPKPTDKKVIMVIMDNINYDDMVNFGGKNLKHLLENGALGLMNTNSGGPYTNANAYTTMGAGGYAVGSMFGSCSGGYKDFFFDEPVFTVYKRNTGLEVKEENIVNVDISTLKRNNESLDHTVKIGFLGTLLNENGLKTAIIGNENQSIDEISANAALITMDNNGITDFGLVNSNLLTKDCMSPFGIKTNYDEMYKAYNEIGKKADFIVLQLGDTYRLNKYSGNLMEERTLVIKSQIFKEADMFLGEIINSLDKNSLLIFAAPFPTYEDSSEGKKFTPLILYGESVPKGIVTSATTKRDGIVTNTDIAPVVLDFFGISRQSPMTGHKFTYKNMDNPLEYLQNINTISVFNYNIRPIVIRVFIAFIITILLLSILLMVYCKNYSPYVKPFLTAIMITPTVFLILPLFNPWNTTRFVLSILGLVAILSIILTYGLKNNLSIFTTLLISVALILIDTFLGNPLMKVSILGYDPIAGARFYGIGNEFMGFLLGSTIIGTTSLVDKYRGHEKLTKAISVIVYIVVLLTLALPNLGTNVGGSMAAFIGFGAAVLLLYKGKITLQDIAYIGIVLIICLLGLFIYDGMRPSDVQSHIGQTSSLVKQNSVFALFQIFGRKLAMNYKLIRFSIWTWALFAIIGVLAVLFKWPMGILKEIFKEHKYLYFGFIAGIISTVAAFVFNDSGVVAAAVSMIPISTPLILLCVDKICDYASIHSHQSSDS